MSTQVLLDTGPLVASINRRERHHDWARAQFARTAPPMWTCEPVLAESCFLLRQSPGGGEAVLELVRRGVLAVGFRTEDHVERIIKLMAKYVDVPMSLADACLVRMSELQTDVKVMTLDADFRIYRRHGRQTIPCLAPPTE